MGNLRQHRGAFLSLCLEQGPVPGPPCKRTDGHQGCSHRSSTVLQAPDLGGREESSCNSSGSRQRGKQVREPTDLLGSHSQWVAGR